MINGIHHVSIATTNLDRMLSFYGELMGRPTRRLFSIEPGNDKFDAVVGMKGVKMRGAHLQGGNVDIELFEYSHPIPRPAEVRPACDAGIRHICFDVTDIMSEYRRLQAAGVVFFAEPQRLSVTTMSAYCRDPEGNIVEIQELLDGASKKDRPPYQRPSLQQT